MVASRSLGLVCVVAATTCFEAQWLVVRFDAFDAVVNGPTGGASFSLNVESGDCQERESGW